MYISSSRERVERGLIVAHGEDAMTCQSNSVALLEEMMF